MKRWNRRRTERSEAMFLRMYRDDAVRKQRWRCCYCLEPIAVPTADHVRPRAAGGLTHRENIRAACWPCNRAKGDMPVAQFKALLAARSLPHRLPLSLMMAWARHRIWSRTLLAERRILALVGLAA